MLSNISDVLSSQLNTIYGTILFVLLVAVIFSSAYYLLIYLKSISSELRIRKPIINTIYGIIYKTQFILMAIVGIISIQIFFLSQYFIPLLVAATIFGYVIAGMIMTLLGYYLFSWFMSTKKNIMIVLFAISAFMTAAASISLGISQGGLFLEHEPLTVVPNVNISYPSINPELTGMLGNLLSIAYIETMLSYVLTWCAASILLFHYSKNIGIKKYLSLVILPMGLFIIGIMPILFSLPTTSSYFDQKLLIFRIISISSLIAVGIMFGFAFRVLVKSINTQIKGHIIDYLKISSYGLAFLFIVLAANMAPGSYPPFGVSSYAFTALASYFFMTGIYSSAIVISTNSELRRKIRDSTIEQSKLLDNIGSAYMERELERRILPLASKYSEDMEKKTGLDMSFSYSEAKEYIKQTIDEIKQQKNNS
jgi:hypothetical protein